MLAGHFVAMAQHPRRQPGPLTVEHSKVVGVVEVINKANTGSYKPLSSLETTNTACAYKSNEKQETKMFIARVKK